MEIADMTRLKEIRRERGLTQAEAAAGARVPLSTWNRVEKHGGGAHPHNLKSIARWARLKVADLLADAASEDEIEERVKREFGRRHFAGLVGGNKQQGV